MGNSCVLYLWLAVVLQQLISGQSHEIKTVVVNIGRSAEFLCNHSRLNLNYLRWVYRPHDTPEREIDLYDLRNNEVRENYEASCREDEPVCRLKLLRAKDESAGTYICKTANGDFKFIQPFFNLVVGGLKCLSNIGADRVMVGENVCKDVHLDVLKKTCMFEYRGNLTQPPVMGWIRRYKDGNKIEENFQSGHRQGLNIFSLHDDIKVNNDMNDALFKCHARGFSQIEPCSLPTFSVLSVKSTIPKMMIPENAKNITCSFISSANVKCSCLWTHSFGMAETKIHGCLLPEIYRKHPGTYVCDVICQLSPDKECHIKSINTVAVEAKKEEQCTVRFLNIAILCLVSVATMLLIFVLFCLYSLKRQGQLSMVHKSISIEQTKHQQIRDSNTSAFQINGLPQTSTMQLSSWTEQQKETEKLNHVPDSVKYHVRPNRPEKEDNYLNIAS